MSDYYLGSMPLLIDEQLKEIRMAGYSVTIQSLDACGGWSVQAYGPSGNVGNIGYTLAFGVNMLWQLLDNEITIAGNKYRASLKKDATC